MQHDIQFRHVMYCISEIQLLCTWFLLLTYSILLLVKKTLLSELFLDIILLQDVFRDSNTSSIIICQTCQTENSQISQVCTCIDRGSWLVIRTDSTHTESIVNKQTITLIFSINFYAYYLFIYLYLFFCSGHTIICMFVRIITVNRQ